MFGKLGPLEILLLLQVCAVYSVPTIVAAVRHSRNLAGVLLVNILAGWTLVGWIIALVWAVRSPRKAGEASSQQDRTG